MSNRGRRDYLEGSWFVGAARRIRGRIGGAWERALRRLASAPWARQLRQDWRQTPLRWTGIAVVSAVCANGLALLLLRRDVGPAGVALRLLFLAAGLLAIRCGGAWTSVRDGSWVLRLLFTRRD